MNQAKMGTVTTMFDDPTDTRAGANNDPSVMSKLAGLSPVEYDKQRKVTAKYLGIRTETLDREVARLRTSELEVGGQG